MSLLQLFLEHLPPHSILAKEEKPVKDEDLVSCMEDLWMCRTPDCTGRTGSTPEEAVLEVLVASKRMTIPLYLAVIKEELKKPEPQVGTPLWEIGLLVQEGHQFPSHEENLLRKLANSGHYEQKWMARELMILISKADGNTTDNVTLDIIASIINDEDYDMEGAYDAIVSYVQNVRYIKEDYKVSNGA